VDCIRLNELANYLASNFCATFDCTVNWPPRDQTLAAPLGTAVYIAWPTALRAGRDLVKHYNRVYKVGLSSK
jgi:hypothetical protein